MKNDITLEEAFEVLQAAIEDAITSVQDSGSDAIRQGDFDDAEKAIQQARTLDNVRNHLEHLKDEFDRHIVSEVTSENDPHRLKKGLKTSQEAYRHPILESIVELGGSANINDVLDHVYDKMEEQLNEYDHASLPSDSDLPRWRNTAQWARNALRSEGLLRSDSPRGTWEISDKGRKWLQNQQ